MAELYVSGFEHHNAGSSSAYTFGVFFALDSRGARLRCGHTRQLCGQAASVTRGAFNCETDAKEGGLNCGMSQWSERSPPKLWRRRAVANIFPVAKTLIRPRRVCVTPFSQGSDCPLTHSHHHHHAVKKAAFTRHSMQASHNQMSADRIHHHHV